MSPHFGNRRTSGLQAIDLLKASYDTVLINNPAALQRRH